MEMESGGDSAWQWMRGIDSIPESERSRTFAPLLLPVGGRRVFQQWRDGGMEAEGGEEV